MRVLSFVYICYSQNKFYVRIHSKFHSGWAYIALLLLVIAVINAAVGCSQKNLQAKS
jgi:succinate dehydrogenase hydrophobic anchor subunit